MILSPQSPSLSSLSSLSLIFCSNRGSLLNLHFPLFGGSESVPCVTVSSVHSQLKGWKGTNPGQNLCNSHQFSSNQNRVNQVYGQSKESRWNFQWFNLMQQPSFDFQIWSWWTTMTLDIIPVTSGYIPTSKDFISWVNSSRLGQRCPLDLRNSSFWSLSPWAKNVGNSTNLLSLSLNKLLGYFFKQS